MEEEHKSCEYSIVDKAQTNTVIILSIIFYISFCFKDLNNWLALKNASSSYNIEDDNSYDKNYGKSAEKNRESISDEFQ